MPCPGRGGHRQSGARCRLIFVRSTGNICDGWNHLLNRNGVLSFLELFIVNGCVFCLRQWNQQENDRTPSLSGLRGPFARNVYDFNHQRWTNQDQRLKHFHSFHHNYSMILIAQSPIVGRWSFPDRRTPTFPIYRTPHYLPNGWFIPFSLATDEQTQSALRIIRSID